MLVEWFIKFRYVVVLYYLEVVLFLVVFFVMNDRVKVILSIISSFSNGIYPHKVITFIRRFKKRKVIRVSLVKCSKQLFVAATY